MSSSEQRWSSKTYADNARFVSELGAEVLSWLAPKAGERILDLGCGDGVLSQKLVEAGAEVVGVDMSEDFVASACRRGIDARLMSGEALAFEAEFDAVFSNAAMHWMQGQDAVIAGVARALKPGGRFVGEFGGHGNVAAIVTGLRAIAARYGIDEQLAHPWVFPTAEEHAARLQAGGFEVRRIVLEPRPTPLATGIKGWLATFRQPFFNALPEGARNEALDELCNLLKWSLCDASGQWMADYVRLRFEVVERIKSR